MQTIILKHVQVFVVITFEIFQIFVWDRGVGGWVGSTVSKLFLDFFYIYKVPYPYSTCVAYSYGVLNCIS